VDDPRLANVPGFGGCKTCPYLTSAPAELCFACARLSIERLSPPDKRCTICDLPFLEGEKACRNPLCASSSRWFDWNFAIAMRSGQLEDAINALKFYDRKGWALIFGRILVGFLSEQAPSFEDFDLIIASPTFVGRGGRAFDHTRIVIQQASAESPPGLEWPFDLAEPPAIVKTGPTDSLTGKTYQQRREIAEQQLRVLLHVPDPARTEGKRILVYDDVFTDGRTLNEVARALRTDGRAKSVCGVTLCRQPWKSSKATKAFQGDVPF